MTVKTGKQRQDERRARDKALGRKRADISMTDQEKVAVIALLKKMRNRL